MESCRVLVTVFGREGMCLPTEPALHRPGEPSRPPGLRMPYQLVLGDSRLHLEGPDRAGLAGRVNALLARRGLRVLRVVPAADPGCFALLFHAETRACAADSLLELEEELRREGEALGVSIRVFREELFRAMHRV